MRVYTSMYIMKQKSKENDSFSIFMVLKAIINTLCTIYVDCFYHIIQIMQTSFKTASRFYIFFLYDQSHSVHASLVLFPCRNNIDSCGVNIAVSQHICQLHNIFVGFIKCSGKQVAKIVRENLLWIHPGAVAQFFHHFPDIAAVHWLSIFCHKERAAGNPLSVHIFF